MFTIIQDTKEKQGWDFGIYNSGIQQIKSSLKTGDYTLQGYEDILCIERKRTSGELAINLGKKWKQFHAELKRMSMFRFPYVICEFSLDVLLSFPNHSTIPTYKWKYIRMTPQFLYKRIVDYTALYGIELVFTENTQNAQRWAMDIFLNTVKVIKSEQEERNTT